MCQIFGTNLRQLCQSRRSVSAVSKDLGISRTQFNRYLSGESFPRPDVLYLICRYFLTDAHILLEPLNAQLNDECTLLTHSEIKAFYTPGPNLCGAVGFVIWPITVRPPQFCGLNNLYTRSVAGVSGQTGNLYPRAISHRINAAGWAWETPTSPQVAGLFNRQDYGISGLISGKSSGAQSYIFLASHRNEQPNFWLGYCTQSTDESVSG